MKNITFSTIFAFLISFLSFGQESSLIITEIMFDPITESNGEWIEIYNNGDSTVNLSGFILDDNSGNELTVANISEGMLAAGKSLILFDGDLSLEEFKAAWGNVDGIPVSKWPLLNNSGDSIGIWDSLDSYSGDNDTQLNVVAQVVYSVGVDWPSKSDSKSIFLIGLDFDPNQGGNWSVSSTDLTETGTPLFNTYESTQGDIGSPGIATEAVDTEAPMITCPSEMKRSTDEDSCEGLFSLELPEVTDNTSIRENIEIIGIRSDNRDLLDSFSVGETTITWTAKDEAGNTSEACEQLITVTSDNELEIKCSAAINIIGSLSQYVDVSMPEVFNDCFGPITMSSERSDNVGLSNEDLFPIGTTTITWTALDAANNIATCTQVITIAMELSSENEISHFNIPNQIGESAINIDAKTITVKMPTGTDVSSLTPDLISVSDGATVTPALGEEQNFTESAIYQVIAEDGSTQDWTVIVEIEEVSLLVTGYTLINADTNEDIQDLVEGEIFDIFNLPTQHLDIRVNTNENVESVRVNLSGAMSTSRTESLEPFALYRDLPVGDYIGANFEIGQYTVSATPYSENGLGGEMGELFSLNFEIINSSPIASVTGFTLINADTNESIRDLVAGEKIDINALETRHLDIRVNTTDDVESVRISLSGALTQSRTESLRPYALFQDLPIGDYIGADFVVGEYTVSSTPYTENGLGGEMGNSLELNFELVDGDPNCLGLAAKYTSIDPSACGGSGSITIIPSGGTPPYEVAWTSFSFDGETVTGLSAGNYSANIYDSAGCSIRIDVQLLDPELPEVTLDPFLDVLTTDAIFELSGGLPVGGTYSGDGVSSDMFDPSIGIGTYEITYTYIDKATECSNMVIQEITVNAESTNNIITYWLVNADNEMDLFPITDTMQIDISTLPSQNLEIRAETGSDTESVGFLLSGTESIMRSESVPPYALFQDLPIGDYIGHAFELGEYTLDGTPYTANNLNGFAGENLTISFEFIDSTPTLAVTGFTLIDATDESEHFDLIDGMKIRLSEIESLFLDIRANTSVDVESVLLELSGAQSTSRTESRLPYALFQDLPIGDYKGNNFNFGEYTVSATPYSENNLKGDVGVPFTISFRIINDLVANSFKISPNEATTLAIASFDTPIEVEQILTFDMLGRQIESYNPEYIKSGDAYVLDVSFYQPGTYIVRAIDTKGIPYQKQMLVKRE